MRLKAFILILCHDLCSTLAQIAFKKSARKFSASRLSSVRDVLAFLLEMIKMPGIWWGMFIIACGTFSWLVALAHVDLSVAIPLDSMHALLILLVSYVFLREPMSWTRILGTILIISGIAFVAIS